MRVIPIFMLISVLTLVTCSGGQQQGEVTYVTNEQGQEIPLGGTLIHGSISDLNSLNPYTINSALARDLSYLIFINLVDINQDLETYSPRLAKSWEFSEDRKKLTFYLRNDVYWWDGVQTTAHDVVFSNELATDPQVAWSAIKWKEFIEDVEALDDTTVVFHFTQVYPYQIMDANVCSIVPEHILGDIPRSEISSAEFNTSPVGNGPFILKSWRSQEQLEFVRNPDYYEPGKPYLDRIVVRIVPDRTTLLTQLKTGKIDFLEQVPPKEFQQMKQDFDAGESDIKPYEFIGRSYDFVAWNTIDSEKYDPQVHTSQAALDGIPNPLFASKEVRRALTMAINRQLIRDAIGYGMLIPMNGTISPILWAHDPSIETLPYDPEEARRILEAEGWIDEDGDGILEKNGQEFRFIMKTNTGNERREQATTLIQDMLKQVGIIMEIRMEEGVTFFSNMVNKDFDAALLGWSIGLKVDFTQILHTDSRLDKYNFTSYGNPEFDRYNDEAKMIMDQDRAKNIWREAQEVLIEDQPYTWLYYMKSGHGLHKRFKGVVMDERGAWVNLYEWWVPAEERKYWMPSS